MAFTTKIFEAFGLNRDSLALFFSKWIAFCVGVASLGIDLHADYGLPVWAVRVIQFTALFVAVSSAQHRTSDLPPESQKIDVSKTTAGKAGAILLAAAIGAGVLSACASLPIKQQAVVTLQASETALEAAHDAERILCSPTADQTAPIRHCDGAQAIAIGLTDARHQTIARVFATAFDTQIKAAAALKVWRAGDPAPSSVADYQRDISDVLALVRQLIPQASTVVTQAQDAVDQAAAVATIIGVK